MKIRFPDPRVPRPPSTPWEQWLAEGLLTLAANCDGAIEEDGVGFNKDDTSDGHDWAGVLISEDGLPEAGWDWCRENLPKYAKNQIGEPPR